MAAVLDGDASAFGRIYIRHVDAVFRYLALRVRDPYVAEDLTHEVFTKALRSLSTLRQPNALAGWLARIAHNVAANHWRYQDRRRTASMDAPDEERLPLEQRLGREDRLTAVEAGVEVEALLDAVDGLTEDQRQVIALRFGAGITLAEAAQLMRRSPEAVKQLQYRALEALRAHVETAQ